MFLLKQILDSSIKLVWLIFISLSDLYFIYFSGSDVILCLDTCNGISIHGIDDAIMTYWLKILRLSRDYICKSYRIIYEILRNIAKNYATLATQATFMQMQSSWDWSCRWRGTWGLQILWLWRIWPSILLILCAITITGKRLKEQCKHMFFSGY